MDAQCEESLYEKYILAYVLVREGLATDDVGVAKGTLFKVIQPWAGFDTGGFVKEKLEGLP